MASTTTTTEVRPRLSRHNRISTDSRLSADFPRVANAVSKVSRTQKRHMRSSRRAPVLRDEDYDHEIAMLEQNGPLERIPSIESRATIQGSSRSEQPLAQSESRNDLTPAVSQNGKAPSSSKKGKASEEADKLGGPDIVVQPATPADQPQRTDSVGKPISKRYPPRPKKANVAYDILWENQRGGFFCGLPLFSSAALGNLDPPAWTNSLHKPSPTNTNTAQVPDPSWEWKDPEWRLHHDETIGTDENGWEYSFMFARKFSWHGPRWWNSFVRRRAWIRYRIKKEAGYETYEGGLMNADYFQITPARQRHRSPSGGGSRSRHGSMSSRSQASQDIPGDHRLSTRLSMAFSEADDASFEIPPEIIDIEDLMVLLKSSRIDREKLEAVETYIKTCEDDLLKLQEHMHEILRLFIFQASRRLLLARLTHLYDEFCENKGKGKAEENRDCYGENLAAAIRHADEEVRKLEYWSDIKGIAESGESTGAVARNKGWGQGWQGIDKSGAKCP